MRLRLILVLLSISSVARGETIDELPTHPDMKLIPMDPVAQGKVLDLSFRVVLPPGQKLNRGGWSHFTVYERGTSGWREVSKVDLNLLAPFGGLIAARRTIAISPKADLAVDATVFHCGSEKASPCTIDNFQGQAQRLNVEGTPRAVLSLIGSAPIRVGSMSSQGTGR